ncbi:hypothetical protein ASD14_08530 [Lysobacter sp. Root494]|nr:hypothetical protein ASD14_08530 [Lysobacter sp. Root494]
MSCWRLHHHPTLQPGHHFGSESFQSRDLGGNIVGLNVDMYPTLMLHALNLHDGFIRRSLEHAVVAASTRVYAIDRTAERALAQNSAAWSTSGVRQSTSSAQRRE